MGIQDYNTIIKNSHPQIIFAERFDETSLLWDHSYHSHPFVELIYFLGGKGDTEVSGVRHSYSAFDTAVYPSGQMHQDIVSIDANREIICLLIDIPELKLEDVIRLREKDGILRRAFNMVYTEGKRKEKNALLLEYSIKYLLTLILNENEVQLDKCDRFHDVVQYIDEHYMERITIDELAEIEHVSRSYLQRKFKERYGMAIIPYVNHKRLEMAKELLLSTELRIGEIGERVGYETPNYLHKVFVKMTGMSPSEFRSKYQIRERVQE